MLLSNYPILHHAEYWPAFVRPWMVLVCLPFFSFSYPESSTSLGLHPCFRVVHASHPKLSLNFCGNYDFKSCLSVSVRNAEIIKSSDSGEETGFSSL